MMNVAVYLTISDKHHEYIDFDDTLSALSRQQRTTNKLIDNLSKTLN